MFSCCLMKDVAHLSLIAVRRGRHAQISTMGRAIEKVTAKNQHDAVKALHSIWREGREREAREYPQPNLAPRAPRLILEPPSATT